MKKFFLLIAAMATFSAGFAAVNHAPSELNVKSLPAVSVQQAASDVSATMRTDFSSLSLQPKKAAATATAKYRRPAGSFFLAALTPKDGLLYYFSFLVQRPILPYTYTNASQNATSYSWKYRNYSFADSKYEWFTSSDVDLVYQGAWGESDSIPQLTATDGTNSNTFHPQPFVYNSTTATWSTKSDGYVAFDVNGSSIMSGTADSAFWFSPKPVCYGTRSKAKSNGILAYTGAKAPTGASKGYFFGSNASGFDGLAVAVEKPAYPYALSGAKIYYRVDSVKQPFQLKFNVFKLVKPETWDTVKSSTGTDSLVRVAPVLGDIIAEGVATVPATSSRTFAFAVAPFQKLVPDGPAVNDTISVSDPIIVTVTGYNNTGVQAYGFTSYIGADNLDDELGENGYIYYSTADQWIGMTDFFTTTFHTAPAIYLDCQFPFIVYNYNNENGEYIAPKSGGSRAVQYYASKPSSAWSFKLADGSDVPDWITIAPKDSLDADAGAYTNITNVTYTVAALPAGVTSRMAKINVSAVGSNPCYFLITQSAGDGVNTVGATTSKVSVVGGNFVINSAANDVVRIFNVAGQFLKSAPVSQGQTVIDGQDYAKGIYVVKFQNGKSYKVAK
jgi:hypothetical protein